ncbi:MAG: DUF2007 domain-containing protein [Clostridia bacterium]|nr:DUF2007 domain-containing protein [Clostridia bacterium]
MEEKKLFEDSDEFLVKQIERILKENDIPYVRKDEGAGSYMNVTYGQSFGLGKSIYVSSENFEKAQNVIEVFNEQDFENEEIPEELKETQEELEEDIRVNEKYGIPKKIFKILIMLGFGIPLLCIIIGIIAALKASF